MTTTGLGAHDGPPTDTRGRILATASELFARQGFQHTSLREIGDRIGLTKAAILYHFPSKDRLLAALLDPLLADLATALETARGEPPQRARWLVLEGFLDTMLRHRRALGMLVHDIALLARTDTYARLLEIVTAIHGLVAGPGASRIDRVRAVQATAMLSDPVVLLADVPADQLRCDMLDGVRRLLPDLEDPDLDDPAPGALTGRPDPGRRRRSGRPRVMGEDRIRLARRMHADGSHSMEQIAASLGVSRATVYRHLSGAAQSQKT